MKNSIQSSAGFTLVELMVSTAIIGLLMLILVSMTNQTSQTWRSTTEKIEKFQGARDGFESMTRKLSQATLNPNWDYLDSAGNPRSKNYGADDWKKFIPVYYGRVTDLRFLSGPMSRTTNFAGLDPTGPVRPGHGVFFQAPFGFVGDTATYGKMDNLVSTWGYYGQAGLDPSRPSFVDAANSNVPNRWRTRLMEFMQPAENMSLYAKTDNTYKWFTVPLDQKQPAPVRVLAENVLTLIILPKLSKSDEDTRTAAQNVQASMLSPWYVYDSYPLVNNQPMQTPANPGANGFSDPGMINPKNQLPPVLQVTMIAVDERSADRLASKYQQSPYMGVDQAAARAGVDYTSLFTNLLQYPLEGPGGDLSKYESVLVNEKLTYRIFTSNVTIRGAKWSRVQSR